MTSDLTTKAAEIRAGLVAELLRLADCDSRAGEPLGKCMRKAAALIEQQAAELAEARAENGKLVELIKFWIDDSVAAHRAHTTAESERDELLREKERLGAALKPFAEKAGGYDGIPAPKYFGDTDFEHSYSPATKVSVSLGDLRRARSALAPLGEE